MHELLTPEEMARADAATIEEGTAGYRLMLSAGAAVADAVSQRLAAGGSVLVLCGTGNNGGDGFVAAQRLAETGSQARVALLGKSDAITGDARLAYEDWRGRTAEALPRDIRDADIVIDALFGAGLSRDLEGRAREIVEAVNGSGIPVVAVDLPSGIDGASGAVRGTAIRAAETVTFFRFKPGHLLYPGRGHCGETRLADIGIAPEVLSRIAPRCFANGPALWQEHYPQPAGAGHKYVKGHAVVVSGGAGRTGAARLSAGAALRAGAGLVTVASPRSALLVNAAHLTAVMLRPVDGADELSGMLEDERLNTVVLGPGLGTGESTSALVAAALASKAACVVDADALTAFKDDAESLFRAIAAREAATVLTPHGGEFSRLFGALSEGSKLDLTREAARMANAVVIHKGPDTVIAAPDGRAAINANAPPWLATAGTGDVLAGIVGGLLAQSMPAFEAAAAAVWLQGEAGRVAGPGMTAEDLDQALKQAVACRIAPWPGY